MHKVAKRDARLQGASEADENGLGHVQGHNAGRRCEGHETRACGEGDAEGEARVGVAARANAVRHKHAVEPRVDDAVTRAERNASTLVDELWEGLVRRHIDGLRVGGGVAEGLHDQVSREAQAGQVLQLVARHGARCVLRAHRRHKGLTVHARLHTVQAACLAHHFLCKGIALGLSPRRSEGIEAVNWAQPKRRASLLSQAAADDEGNAASSLHLVKEHLRLELPARSKNLAGGVVRDLPLVGEDVDDVTHVHLAHVQLNGQRARILHGVEEDWCNVVPKNQGALAIHDSALLLVGDARDVVAHVPEDRIRGRLAGGASAHDITHVRQGVALLQQIRDLCLGVGDAITRVHQHGKRVQRNVRAGPGVGRRGEVIGVRLASDLEDCHGEFFRDLRSIDEPLCLRPGIDNLLGLGVASLHLVLHVIVGVEHQKDAFQSRGCGSGNLTAGVKGLHQGGHIVAALHHAQQLDGLDRGHHGRSGLALHHHAQEVRLRVGCVVHARGHAVADQVQQEGLVARGRLLQQRDHGGHVGGRERQRRNVLLGALCYVRLVLGLEAHGRVVVHLRDLHHHARLGLGIAARLARVLDVRHWFAARGARASLC
mmetsp:Transcript_16437/g.22562  ORF Transcript_16437/g.22562 Transcript_16437/m.22562 type:complete len:600 (-) Transcript_16437:43-1842(-)